MQRILKIFQSMLLPTNEYSKQDNIFLVIGPAGSGKTSFINAVAQKENLKVKHNLGGATEKVKSVICALEPRVVLVDTPPYPDDDKQEGLFKWLGRTDRPPVKGVIYLHPITSNRGRPEENFKNLKALSNAKDFCTAPVILVTTHWRRHEAHKRCLERMQDLIDGWTSSNISGPGPVAYDGSPDSAWNIFKAVVKKCGIELVD